jgi:hypothetical protein
MGRQAKLKKLRKRKVVSYQGDDAQRAFKSVCDLNEDAFNEDGSLKAAVYERESLPFFLQGLLK